MASCLPRDSVREHQQHHSRRLRHRAVPEIYVGSPLNFSPRIVCPVIAVVITGPFESPNTSVAVLGQHLADITNICFCAACCQVILPSELLIKSRYACRITTHTQFVPYGARHRYGARGAGTSSVRILFSNVQYRTVLRVPYWYGKEVQNAETPRSTAIRGSSSFVTTRSHHQTPSSL